MYHRKCTTMQLKGVLNLKMVKFDFMCALIEEHHSYQRLFMESKNIAHSLRNQIFKSGKYTYLHYARDFQLRLSHDYVFSISNA